MTPSLAYSSAFALADRVIVSLLESGTPGTVLSIDFGNSLFDLIAANTAPATGCDFVASPTLLRHRARRRSLLMPVRPAEVIEEPVIFGRIDGYLRTSDDSHPLESYEAWQEEVATRSIDSWITGRRSLRLLHVGDGELIADQLAGARNTIARDRPLITLYPARQDRTELMALLDSLGYQPFNLGGKSATQEFRDPQSDFGWIVLPKERVDVFAGLATLHSQTESGDFAASWHSISENASLPRQRRSRALFGLTASGLPPPTRMIGTAEIASITDCYPLESEGSHSWRWLGPRPRSRIALPCPLPGAYRAVLTVLNSHLENSLYDCRIIAEGREVSALASDTTPGKIEFVGVLDPADYAGYMKIDVVSMGRIPPSEEDPRVLRMSLQSISVSQCQ